MILEAQLLVTAEQVLAEVLGRIRPQDSDIELPALHPRAPGASLSDAVARHLQDDALLSAGLVRTPLAPTAVQDPVTVHAGAVCAAAAQVDDGGELVDGGGGLEPARDLLLRAVLERALLAHYVAAYLGSTACPLPEELARPLWELTAPDAATWRARGYFRAPMPLPDHVSWRDRFLLEAGHEPHPLGH
ncbi:hypothetical protein BH24ACT10_BH24ACT10_04970 [soil metagenome]